MALEKRSHQYKCGKCNRNHDAGRCPAFGKTCFLCKGDNHFAACCRRGSQVREVLNDQDNFDILDVRMCSVGRKADWIVNAKVADQAVALKVDTGSHANLLPYSVYRRCGKRASLKPSSSVLRSYNGDVIKHIGVATLRVLLNSRPGDVDFFIVKKGNQAILGLLASEALGLVSRSADVVSTCTTDEIVKEFHQLFQGTGCVARQYRMVLREDATPVVQPA